MRYLRLSLSKIIMVIFGVVILTRVLFDDNISRKVSFGSTNWSSMIYMTGKDGDKLLPIVNSSLTVK